MTLSLPKTVRLPHYQYGPDGKPLRGEDNRALHCPGIARRQRLKRGETWQSTIYRCDRCGMEFAPFLLGDILCIERKRGKHENRN